MENMLLKLKSNNFSPLAPPVTVQLFSDIFEIFVAKLSKTCQPKLISFSCYTPLDETRYSELTNWITGFSIFRRISDNPIGTIGIGDPFTPGPGIQLSISQTRMV